MKPKSNTLLLTTALLAVAVPVVWLVSGRNAAPPDPARRASSHRDRQADREEASRSKAGKPARELSNDDLLAICNREGAAAALAAAKSHPWPHGDERVYFILTHLAGKDPEFAAAALKTAGLSYFLKTGLLDSVLKNWNDGRKALDWAENQLTGELRCKAVTGALGILAKSEPDAAFGFFKGMPDSKARNQAMSELFAAWGSHDPHTALTRAKELTPDDAPSATEHLLRGWAKADPEAAAAWVLKTAPTDGSLIAGVLQSWNSISPDQAKLWFDSLPDGEAKKSAFLLTYTASGGISMPVFSIMQFDTWEDTWSSKPVSERGLIDLMRWTAQDFESALSFVERNGTDPAADLLGRVVAMAISGRSGPSDAIDWARRLPQKNREPILDAILTDWADRDSAAALGKLEALSPALDDKAPIRLVNRLVTQDPAAVADWVAGWKGDYHTDMVQSLIDTWPDQDPEAAYQWLGSLPAGPGRDAGITRLVENEERTGATTDSLMPWIDLISDPRLREKTRRDLDKYLKTARDR